MFIFRTLIKNRNEPMRTKFTCMFDFFFDKDKKTKFGT